MAAMATPCILDLDGTLMPSHAVDNRCYWQAVFEVFGHAGDTLELQGFNNVTDDGLLDEWSAHRLGRAVKDGERTEVRRRFFDLIERAATDSPDAFRPLPGLEAWLASRPRGSLAVATGGWPHTAARKLELAGLDTFHLPLAGSAPGEDRPAIMRRARALLAPAFADATPIYFGDAPWDAAAARALGWGFVGVAAGERAGALREAGAERIVDDFQELAGAD